jgi:hypothetical protein
MIIEIMQIIAIIGLVGGSSLIVYKYFSTHGFYGDDNTNNTQTIHPKTM